MIFEAFLVMLFGMVVVFCFFGLMIFLLKVQHTIINSLHKRSLREHNNLSVKDLLDIFDKKDQGDKKEKEIEDLETIAVISAAAITRYERG